MVTNYILRTLKEEKEDYQHITLYEGSHSLYHVAKDTETLQILAQYEVSYMPNAEGMFPLMYQCVNEDRSIKFLTLLEKIASQFDVDIFEHKKYGRAEIIDMAIRRKIRSIKVMNKYSSFRYKGEHEKNHQFLYEEAEQMSIYHLFSLHQYTTPLTYFLAFKMYLVSGNNKIIKELMKNDNVTQISEGMKYNILKKIKNFGQTEMEANFDKLLTFEYILQQ